MKESINIPKETIDILLVEDNEGDIFLISEAMADWRIQANLEVKNNGQEALDFLFQRNGYKNSNRPDLILLDINLPLKNGHEVLKEIKSSDSLKEIPVLMLTTSSSDFDVKKAFDNQATSFLTKPNNYDELKKLIDDIERIWFTEATK